MVRRIAMWARKSYENLQKTRDSRSFFTRQALATMLSIKIFADENRWISILKQHRKDELDVSLKVRLITSFNGMFYSLASASVPIVIFTWVTQIDKNTLDAASAFTTLLIISQITWSIGMIPDIFNSSNHEPTNDHNRQTSTTGADSDITT